MALVAKLGGTDITSLCLRLAHEPELNLRSMGEVEVPSELCPAFTEGGDELEIIDGGTTVHVGRAYYGEDTGGSDERTSVIRSYGPTVWWDRRQVMDADGDYSDPSIIEDNLDAVSIMAAAIDNSIANDGPMDISVNSAAGGGSPLVGWKPTDWPMTLEQLREFLVNTGQLDLVVNHAVGGASTVDLYNGDFGSDLTGSVAFGYRTGSFNCTSARQVFDFTRTISRIRYFLGPKRPQYDGDVQHWAGDVQIDDPALDVAPFDVKEPTIESRSASTETLLMLLRRIQIYDANGDENALRDLYMHIWQSDMLANLGARRLVTVTPTPGVAPSFQCGDLITVAASIRDSVSGPARVYSYRKEQDTEGNVMYASVTTSADQEI
jgi:hypothetical protein